MEDEEFNFPEWIAGIDWPIDEPTDFEDSFKIEDTSLQVQKPEDFNELSNEPSQTAVESWNIDISKEEYQSVKQTDSNDQNIVGTGFDVRKRKRGTMPKHPLKKLSISNNPISTLAKFMGLNSNLSWSGIKIFNRLPGILN